MKWRTPEKKIRNEKWHTAPPPLRGNATKAHRWCSELESENGFYHHYTNTRWWFEKEEDAILFALKYSGR